MSDNRIRLNAESECTEIETRQHASVRRAERLSAFVQDAVVGLRILRKNPAFTMAAIVMLALGIGANSAVFSIVNRVLLQPLPYENSARIMTLTERHENGWGALPWANFIDIRESSHSFDAMAAYSSAPGTVLGFAEPFRANVGVVSSQFFKVFSVRPYMGRFMTDDEHRIGAPAVAVVSYAFWRDHLGAPASLQGLRVKTDKDYEIIGVAQEGFAFPDNNQVWSALETTEQGMSRTAHNWESIGLLRRGVDAIAAQREVDVILARLSTQYQPDFDAVGSRIVSLQETQNAGFRTPLYLVLGASSMVLLAACVNLASAMLARGTARSAEFTVRFALGATRSRVIRQLVIESGLLALGGCIVGLMLAAALLRILTALAPESLHVERVSLDGWAIGFAIIVAVLTTLLFGLLPALRLSRSNVSLALRDGARGTSGVGRMRVWNLLVAIEVAVAVVLLSASALLVKSFGKVMQNSLGFEADGVIAARVELPEINYSADGPAIRLFHERALERLRNIPGVASVGFVNRLPLSGSAPSGSVMIEGKPASPKGEYNAYSIYRVVGGEYFSTVRIPILKGRTFRADGAPEATPSVIVDETFARAEWPNDNPIGKRLKVAGMDAAREDWYDVIGVVGNVRTTSPTSEFAATYYFDHRTRPTYRTRRASYAIRLTGNVATVTPLIRRAFADIDAQVPVLITVMNNEVKDASASRRFPMSVFSAFAGVALIMAIVGIYAVVSYAVAQRTREIGVRIALGATPVGVRSLVLRSAMTAIVPGLIAGAVLAAASASLLRNLLYGVSPFDPAGVLSAVGILSLAAIVSTAVPAIRATRVDPLIAMRAE